MPHTFRNAWHIVKEDYHKFEIDPAVQLKYHRRMAIFWIANFPVINTIAAVDILALFGIISAKLALLINAILLIINTNYSLYANLDTEIGDAHGAYASLKADQIQKRQDRKTLQRFEH